jgi:hypothetical protein
MIAESNFYVLRTVRLKTGAQAKRLKHLENTLAQLQQYHKVCKPLKRVIVLRLMANYENLIKSKEI